MDILLILLPGPFRHIIPHDYLCGYQVQLTWIAQTSVVCMRIFFFLFFCQASL